jgi:hypothetical protein
MRRETMMVTQAVIDPIATEDRLNGAALAELGAR